jgi:hypothetical protein
MFILFFYLGLTLFDPPPENGIAINLEQQNLALEKYNRQKLFNLRQNQQLKLQLQLMTTSFLKIPKMLS